MEEEDCEGAWEALEKAIRLDPDNEELYELREEIRQKIEEKEKNGPPDNQKD